jgi:hypothetical protein
MELVRMTVLVVAGSTDVAFGIEGIGLDSWARRGNGPEIEAATRNVKAQVLMKLQLSPL